MAERKPTADELTVRDTLAQINAAWLERRFENLSPYFADDIVLVAPGFGARIAGREACIATFREFMNRAAVTSYLEDDLRILVTGDTAIADYAWEMTWTDAGKPHRQTGRDLFVFARQDGKWRAVWRTIFPAPVAAAR